VRLADSEVADVPDVDEGVALTVVAPPQFVGDEVA
jgi:hypothetical protein